jgi:hypothetical protein
MSTVGQPASTTSPTGDIGTNVRIGVTHRDLFGRVAVYTTTPVHLSFPSNDRVNIDNETVFGYTPFIGIFANEGMADDLTYRLVRQLLARTTPASVRNIDIRISKSDKSGFASKIVLYINEDSTEEDICCDVATVLYNGYETIETVWIDDEHPSASEYCDQRSYGRFD